MTLSEEGIGDVINRLNTLKKNLDNVGEAISKELGEKTAEQIEHFYNQKGFESTNEKPLITTVKYDKGYKAIARSTGVIYEEFGTGDVGAKHGHPWKGDYGLNPYNSGPTIRSTDLLSKEFKKNLGIKEGKYWTYSDGGLVYTQGNPAGKFMYYSDIWLRNNYKKIAKEKVDDVISKI